eukprot:TRINITY_DN2222_c0_g1_i4.p1 TRINITY_DN2222_c0_g1~~TRINITY_DN2222_c0_g1_i4.p1  ORF type:complete len:206 (-),score=32.56 TRINITY_DN2222_c0_g1_i4:62-679(-)
MCIRDSFQGQDASQSWVDLLQRKVADFQQLGEQAYRVQIENQNKDSLLAFVGSQPQIKTQGDDIIINTYTRNIYSVFQGLDFSQLSPISTEHISVKLKNAKAIWNALKAQGTYQTYTCKDLNQLAINLALSSVPEKTRQRFEQYGTQFVLLDDKQASTGFTWVAGTLSKDVTSNGYEIQSTSLFTDPDMKIQKFAGMQYLSLIHI